MKIINIKNIIAEEISKFVNEMYDEPYVDSGVGRESEHVLRGIEAGVHDALEETGADADKVQAIMDHLHKEELLAAIESGIADYLGKLNVTGRPKPPQMNEGLLGTIAGLGLAWWLGKKMFGPRFKELHDKDPEVQEAVSEIEQGYEKLKQKHPSIGHIQRDAGEIGDALSDMGSDLADKVKGWWSNK